MHEVMRPEMVDMPRSQTDAPSFIEPESTFLRLLHGNLQLLTAPKALDPPVVQLPAYIAQLRRNPAISLAAVLSGQFDHIRDQEILVISGLRENNGVLNDAVPGRDRHGVPVQRACLAPDQCSCGAVQGLEVFPGSLRQYKPLQSEIRDSPANTLVLVLQLLQLYKLIRPHTAILLAPAIIRLLPSLRLPDRVSASLLLLNKHATFLSFKVIFSDLCRFVAVFDPWFTKRYR